MGTSFVLAATSVWPAPGRVRGWRRRAGGPGCRRRRWLPAPSCRPPPMRTSPPRQPASDRGVERGGVGAGDHPPDRATSTAAQWRGDRRAVLHIGGYVGHLAADRGERAYPRRPRPRPLTPARPPPDGHAPDRTGRRKPHPNTPQGQDTPPSRRQCHRWQTETTTKLRRREVFERTPRGASLSVHTRHVNLDTTVTWRCRHRDTAPRLSSNRDGEVLVGMEREQRQLAPFPFLEKRSSACGSSPPRAPCPSSSGG